MLFFFFLTLLLFFCSFENRHKVKRSKPIKDSDCGSVYHVLVFYGWLVVVVKPTVGVGVEWLKSEVYIYAEVNALRIRSVFYFGKFLCQRSPK